jgi:iron complex outermembrane receptor protein
MYFLKVCTLLCVIILSAHIGRAQEKGTISGQVITSDGRVAQGVTISLSGTKNTTASDNNGNYTIKVPTPGHYRIQVSTVGLLSQEKTVSLTAGQNSKVDFQLRENSNQLEVVLVSARTNGQQKRKDSPYIAKLPLKNIENPHVYNKCARSQSFVERYRSCRRWGRLFFDAGLQRTADHSQRYRGHYQWRH